MRDLYVIFISTGSTFPPPSISPPLFGPFHRCAPQSLSPSLLSDPSSTPPTTLPQLSFHNYNLSYATSVTTYPQLNSWLPIQLYSYCHTLCFCTNSLKHLCSKSNLKFKYFILQLEEQCLPPTIIAMGS